MNEGANRKIPAGYEEKFAGLIESCRVAEREGLSTFVTMPESLGDTREEVIESIYRISEAGMQLVFAIGNRPE